MNICHLPQKIRLLTRVDRNSLRSLYISQPATRGITTTVVSGSSKRAAAANNLQASFPRQKRLGTTPNTAIIQARQRLLTIYNTLAYSTSSSSDNIINMPSQQLPAAPKWKSIFLEHISTMDSPTFVFTTLDTIDNATVVPRARFCVFRGFWAELPENKHNTADMNPRVYESEMPAFTTDVRMEKVRQLFGVGKKDKENDEAAISGSGGGAPVEAVWWMEEPATQWRIQGSAYVIARDMGSANNGSGHGSNDGEGNTAAGVRAVRNDVGARMRCVQPGKEAEWSWSRELHGHFGNNSPGLRGSFRGPPPGKPVSTPHDEELKLGTKVKELDDPVALRHFRVVVIKPEVVEQTDLSDPDNSRRYRYTFDAKTSDWSMEELWP